MSEARDHLEWASNRALAYFDRGEGGHAVNSFLSDVTKHEGTSWIFSAPGALLILQAGVKGTREEFQQAMLGFNVA